MLTAVFLQARNRFLLLRSEEQKFLLKIFSPQCRSESLIYRKTLGSEELKILIKFVSLSAAAVILSERSESNCEAVRGFAEQDLG